MLEWVGMPHLKAEALLQLPGQVRINRSGPREQQLIWQCPPRTGQQVVIHRRCQALHKVPRGRHTNFATHRHRPFTPFVNDQNIGFGLQ
ncbi:hypothetical protein D3C79_972930 [compost metagenome]